MPSDSSLIILCSQQLNKYQAQQYLKDGTISGGSRKGAFCGISVPTACCEHADGNLHDCFRWCNFTEQSPHLIAQACTTEHDHL